MRASASSQVLTASVSSGKAPLIMRLVTFRDDHAGAMTAPQVNVARRVASAEKAHQRFRRTVSARFRIHVRPRKDRMAKCRTAELCEDQVSAKHLGQIDGLVALPSAEGRADSGRRIFSAQ